MDVDHAGGRPHPVVLGKGIAGGRIGALLPCAVDKVHFPLYAGEVDAVVFPVFGRPLVLQTFGQRGKGDYHFHAPASVIRGRIVDRPVHMDCGAQAVHVVTVQRAAAVPVSDGKEQIPYSVQNVHFKFIILLRVGIRIDENFKIVVIENHGVPLGDMPPDFISFKLCPEIQIFIIPEDLRPGMETGRRHMGTFNILEKVRKLGVFPERLVQVSVQGERTGGAPADINRRGKGNGRNGNTDCTHVDYLPFRKEKSGCPCGPKQRILRPQEEWFLYKV